MTDEAADNSERTIFESRVRSAGDLAGVFEHDGEVGYFYLYETQRRQGAKIADALRVVSGPLMPEDAAVEIRWDDCETIVGLFIDSRLWAVFDCTTSVGYVGDYGAGVAPELPPRISGAFPLRA